MIVSTATIVVTPPENDAELDEHDSYHRSVSIEYCSRESLLSYNTERVSPLLLTPSLPLLLFHSMTLLTRSYLSAMNCWAFSCSTNFHVIPGRFANCGVTHWQWIATLVELECPRLRSTHAKWPFLSRKQPQYSYRKNTTFYKNKWTTSGIKLTDAYVDGCQRSEPPIELRHLFLKASPSFTGQRRLEDPPTCNDINFYPYLSLTSYTMLSGFFCLIFSPLFL